jgi:hypothetical protein
MRIKRCGQGRQWMQGGRISDAGWKSGLPRYLRVKRGASRIRRPDDLGRPPSRSFLQSAVSGAGPSSDYPLAGARIGFMVKVPLPVQFAVAPLTVQVPVIWPPLTVPLSVRVFTSAPVEVTT